MSSVQCILVTLMKAESTFLRRRHVTQYTVIKDELKKVVSTCVVPCDLTRDSMPALACDAPLRCHATQAMNRRSNRRS
jgi:hypothetical protein